MEPVRARILAAVRSPMPSTGVPDAATASARPWAVVANPPVQSPGAARSRQIRVHALGPAEERHVRSVGSPSAGCGGAEPL
jgi:hypothetical protein